MAYREDLHLASVNSVVLDQYVEDFPAEYVARDNGRPTGVLTEDALEVLSERIDPDPERFREYLLAAQEYAHRHGVTGVHDIIREPVVARQFHELDRDGDLSIRVRLNYAAEYLDAIDELGLVTNHGTDHLTVGAIKAFADGSIGSRTARLSESYTDGEGRGEWTIPPAELSELIDRIDDADLQAMVHGIGDEALDALCDSYEGTSRERHRIEHAELLSEERLADVAANDIVVSAQPNFHKWARDGGLYDDRLGEERRRRSNQFRLMLDAGIALAFGSDCMPMDPLFGIEQAVTAPDDTQRIDTTEAVRAYTRGGAYAGFEEDRLGTIEAGTCADMVVLDQSPWETESIGDLAVEMTIADGAVVFERGRSD